MALLILVLAASMLPVAARRSMGASPSQISAEHNATKWGGRRRGPPPTFAPTPAPTFAPTPAPNTPTKLVFYMYRARNKESYAFNGINTASAAGVMRYIHVEVVGQDVCGSCKPPLCSRKYDIDRIARYKVTMHATPKVFAERRGQFGPFRQFDMAQCTWGGVEACKDTWKKYGFVVGCQSQLVSAFHYPDAVWYSLPGTCPSQPFTNKSAECVAAEPGGECDDPDGSDTCTYKMEEAGEVMLDDVVGIRNYKSFCSKGKVEYNTHDEEAADITFWKGFTDQKKNKWRTNKLLTAFRKKYPDAPSLQEPVCDGF